MAAVESEIGVSSRRRPRWSRPRLAGVAAPYALLVPAALVIGAVLAYPLYLLVRLSFEK